MLQAPACEVQEVISIGAQGTEGQLANALSIEEIIGPCDFLALFVSQPVWRSAGGYFRIVYQGNFHRDWASSKQARKSAGVAPLVK